MAMCRFVVTEKRMPTGEPIWACVNVGEDGKKCHGRCMGERAASRVCDALPKDVRLPPEPRKTFDEMPCAMRTVTLGFIECGCKSKVQVEVKGCSIHGMCTPFSVGKSKGLKKLKMTHPPKACIACPEWGKNFPK